MTHVLLYRQLIAKVDAEISYDRDRLDDVITDWKCQVSDCQTTATLFSAHSAGVDMMSTNLKCQLRSSWWRMDVPEYSPEIGTAEFCITGKSPEFSNFYLLCYNKFTNIDYLPIFSFFKSMLCNETKLSDGRLKPNACLPTRLNSAQSNWQSGWVEFYRHVMGLRLAHGDGRQPIWRF